MTQPNEGTPSVNDTTDREAAIEFMQFGCAFSHILQEIWESDPDMGPVQVSKMDVTDAYHRCTLRMSQVGAFAYVIPSEDNNDYIIICIYLVLPIGWVDLPKCFCAFSETLTNIVNALVNTLLLVPGCRTISNFHETSSVPPHTLNNLTHIDCYMNVVKEVLG